MEAGLIGAKISLTSKSDIRYRGTLHSIDPEASTISLENVVSMGTEDRRPAESTIPGTETVYEFVVFRAADVKDLGIEQPPPPPPPKQPSVLPHDPAIMSVGQNPPLVQQQQRTPQQVYQQPPQQEQQQRIPIQQQQRSQPTAGPSQPLNQSPNVVTSAPASRPPPPRQQSSSSDQLSTALHNVEKAIGELSVGNQRGVPVRRGNQFTSTGQGLPGALSAKAPPVPQEEFDFEEMNKKFEVLRKEMNGGKPKATMSSSKTATNGGDKPRATIVAEEDSSDEEDEEQDAGSLGTSVAYNKQKSFFDSMSSDVVIPAHSAPPGGGGGSNGRGRGRGSMAGGGGGYHWKRSDEAAANMTTFGEAGSSWRGGRGGMRRGRGRGGYNGPRQDQSSQVPPPPQ